MIVAETVIEFAIICLLLSVLFAVVIDLFGQFFGFSRICPCTRLIFIEVIVAELISKPDIEVVIDVRFLRSFNTDAIDCCSYNFKLTVYSRLR